MIDLHRDGVPDDTRLVTEVNGNETAQIMLINGMCRDEEEMMWITGAMITR